MNPRLKFFAGSAIFLTAVVAVILAEKADLAITEETPVWDPVAQPHRQIATLHRGTKIRISECIDIKSYFVYRVRLADGRVGFVDSGPNPVEVRSALAAPYDQAIVWNCY